MKTTTATIFYMCNVLCIIASVQAVAVAVICLVQEFADRRNHWVRHIDKSQNSGKYKKLHTLMINTTNVYFFNLIFI